MGPNAHPAARRRFLLHFAGTAFVVSATSLFSIARAFAAEPLPATVGPVTMPDTPLAQAAAALARADSPGFLFNHCMRTYLFGALLAQRRNLPFDHESVFVGSALHDLGLLEKYASPDQPFEIDGADAAKAFLEVHKVPAAQIDTIWDAIAMHASAIGAHKPLDIRLVGVGASADVFGGGIAQIAKERVDEVLVAFPRLQFNTRFRDLLLDHCRRKPLSTNGTWLDAFCRGHSPGVEFPTIDGAFAQSPFKE